MIGDKDSKEFKGEAKILWTYKKDFNDYGCPLCHLKPPKIIPSSLPSLH